MQMMKKKISWLFLLMVFLTLFSCRNEQDILNEASLNRNRDVITFSAFKKETQIQKMGEVISLLSISQKSIEHDDPLSGFLIDTETINRIKANADISTYSFRIYSLFGNPQDIYNIVYRKRNDGTLHYSIIRIIGNTPYVLYDSEAASAAQKYTHKNAVTKTSSYEDCLASYSVSVWHCKNGCSWDACDKCDSCLETLTVCVGSGGGDNSGGFGGPSNGNPSSPPPPLDPFSEGGSAAYLTDPSGYVFDPNLPPSTDAGYVRALRAYLFWEQLPGALYRQWANEDVDIYQNIIESYLNNYSTANNTENLNFHNQAVQYFMDHPNATWDEFYNQYLSADSPCKKTKPAIDKVNQVLKSSVGQQKIKQVLENKANDNIEWGVAIGQNAASGEYEVTNPASGNVSSVSPPFNQLQNSTAIGSAHSHAGTPGSPSGGDLFSLLERMVNSNNTIKFNLVYGVSNGNNETYALIVTNPALAAQFLTDFPRSKNYDNLTHDIKEKTKIGRDLTAVRHIYAYNYPNSIVSGEYYNRNIIAMAYILDNFNAGLSLAKVDATGNLKKINVSRKKITLPNGIIDDKLIISKCP